MTPLFMFLILCSVKRVTFLLSPVSCKHNLRLPPSLICRGSGCPKLGFPAVWNATRYLHMGRGRGRGARSLALFSSSYQKCLVNEGKESPPKVRDMFLFLLYYYYFINNFLKICEILNDNILLSVKS